MASKSVEYEYNKHRFITSKAGKDQQKEAERISTKAQDKLQNLFDALGEVKDGFGRHIEDYKDTINEMEESLKPKREEKAAVEAKEEKVAKSLHQQDAHVNDAVLGAALLQEQMDRQREKALRLLTDLRNEQDTLHEREKEADLAWNKERAELQKEREVLDRKEADLEKFLQLTKPKEGVQKLGDTAFEAELLRDKKKLQKEQEELDRKENEMVAAAQKTVEALKKESERVQKTIVEKSRAEVAAHEELISRFEDAQKRLRQEEEARDTIQEELMGLKLKEKAISDELDGPEGRLDGYEKRLALMEMITKMFGNMHELIDHGSMNEAIDMTARFGSHVMAADHPDEMKDNLYREAKAVLRQAKEKVDSDDMEDALKTSVKAERKARRSTDASYTWGVLYKLGQLASTKSHGIKSYGQVIDEMFNQLEDAAKNEGRIKNYIENMAAAYTGAKMIGEALNSVNEKGDIHEIPRFFKKANVADYVPRVSYNLKKPTKTAPDAAETAKPSRKESEAVKVKRGDFADRAAALSSYYIDLQSRVQSGDKKLDRKITDAIAAAHKAEAAEAEFVEARALANEGWIRFSGNLTPEMQNRLRVLNSKAMTIQEQDSLLNMELILFLGRNRGTYYSDDGLSKENAMFVKSIANMKFDVEQHTNPEFQSSPQWGALWDDVWNMYRRLKRGSAAENLGTQEEEAMQPPDSGRPGPHGNGSTPPPAAPM